MNTSPETLRIDRWLWQARFYRTRAIAQVAAASGVLRLNGKRVEKPSATVRPGDVLTIPARGQAMVVRVVALGHRRGPAAEARTLYADLCTAPDANTHEECALDRTCAGA